MSSRGLLAAALSAAAILASASAMAVELNLGTLSPERSAAMSALKSFALDVAKKTGNAVTVHVSVAKDTEASLVELMTRGELQGAWLTGAGLSALAPEVAILEAPRLIRTYPQLDVVRAALRARLEKALFDKGLVVLGWGDTGQTFLYTTSRVAAPADLPKTKPWIPTDDTAMKRLYEEAGARPAPLRLGDVAQNLKTGDVNAACASPQTAVSLGWFEHAKLVTGIPLGLGVGATVVTRTAWDAATPEQQKTLRQSAEAWHTTLVREVRAEAAASLKALKKKGVDVVPVSGADEAAWDALAAKVQDATYAKALLEEVRRLLNAVPQ